MRQGSFGHMTAPEGKLAVSALSEERRGRGAAGRRGGRRVALVVSHLHGGGKERCIVDLANALAMDHFEPLIICLRESGALAQRIRPDGVKVIALHKAAGNDVTVPFRLARVLRQERVDVVHSNNWGTLAESVLAAKWARTPSIVHTQHGLEYGIGDSRSRDRHPLRMLAKRVAARWIDRIVAVSHEVQAMVVKEWRVPDRKVSVIHNGIALTARRLGDEERLERRRRIGLGPGDYVIGSVGIFRPVKDFPTLVRAMAHVASRSTGARLVLVGDGPSRLEIEQMVERLKLQPFVRFLGMRADVEDLLPIMDLFVLCSFSEGISLSILEAMAAGVPVVATDVGGNPEIIGQSGVGVLVPPRSPRKTADAILSLLRDPDRRRAMGVLAQERVRERFSLQRMASDYEALYAGIVG